jgi:TonB-linked SusC/RagA family outer membrane protein
MYNFYSKKLIHPLSCGCIRKLILVMKLTTLILFIAIMQVSATTLAQKVTIQAKDAQLSTIFQQIRTQTGYDFAYTTKALESAKTVTINVKNEELGDVLQKIFEDQPLDFTIKDKFVTVTIKQPTMLDRVKSALNLDKIDITGKVFDENNRPLVGVTVKVKGSQTGQTSTNEKGQFSILAVSDNSILQFSSIGYVTVELPVKDLKNPLTVIMKVNTNALDQVQVLAYGTTTKRLATGDITTVTAKQIEDNSVPNVLQAIQNEVPGLLIQQNTGLPGGSFNVQIRPGSTFNPGLFGGGTPLYVVDGVAYPAGTTLPLSQNLVNGTAQGPLLGGNALNYINPNDIESVTVLKDADATAIYGSRGAYGVILITTKKGKAGPPQLNVNFYTGLTVVGTQPQLLNTQQYLMLRNEAFKNDGTKPGPGDLDLNGTWSPTAYTNWQKVLTGNYAPTTNANLSYTGGNGTTNYRITGNYVEQSTTQIGKGDDKSGGLTFDINSTTTDKKFTMDLSGGFNSDVNTFVPFDFTGTSGGSGTLTAPNAPPLYLPNGSLNWVPNGGAFTGILPSFNVNPAAAVNDNSNITTDNLLSTLVFIYKPVNGLTLTSTTGFNLLIGKQFRDVPTTSFDPATNSSALTNSSLNNYTIRTWDVDANADYTRQLGKKGVFDVRVGVTLQDILNTQNVIKGTGFAGDELLGDPSAGAQVNSSVSNSLERYLGYFGQIRYTWDQKYILNVNARDDGSTKFGPGKQFGLFGSLGAAWIFSEEKWFKDNLPFISFGKLRGSYGTVGGNQINNYQYLTKYASDLAYQGKNTLLPFGLANPDLQWQQKNESEIGINLDFFNGRISFEANYYYTKTSNQLILQNLSTVTGFPVYPVNSPAVIQTNGPEVTLTTWNIKSTDFSWKTDFNISAPRNKLLAYPGLNDATLASVNQNYIIGQPITGIKVYNYAGVNPQTGQYNFINRFGVQGAYTLIQALTGGATLDPVLDKTKFIDLNPKFFGGINNTFRYKNLSLGFFFTFTDRIGPNFDGQNSAVFPGFFNQNETTEALQRWTHPGQITNVPKAAEGITALLASNGLIGSTGAYSDATYARLQNLNINYNFTPAFLKKANITNLGVFLRGQNLLTISKYKNLDPENLSAGAAPPLRVFTAGFNMTL